MINIREFLGIRTTDTSHLEKIVSATGGFVSILAILLISQLSLPFDQGYLIVSSMGASAVLLFAVPHGQLSQPWPVFGGHLVSAIIGVACADIFTSTTLAACIAVSLSIAIMYYLRCIHPPGGATALTAVIGGDAIHALGYQFIITPVLLNTVVILAIAIAFNYLLPWRRYPIYLHKLFQQRKTKDNESTISDISHGDFVYALSQLDSFIDVTEYDLLRVYELATQRSRQSHINATDIKLGQYYSNGEYGDNWSVRQLVDASDSGDGDGDMLIYKVVAGKNRRTSGYISRTEFANWAKYQVERDEENWKRIIKRLDTS